MEHILCCSPMIFVFSCFDQIWEICVPSPIWSKQSYIKLSVHVVSHFLETPCTDESFKGFEAATRGRPSYSYVTCRSQVIRRFTGHRCLASFTVSCRAREHREVEEDDEDIHEAIFQLLLSWRSSPAELAGGSNPIQAWNRYITWWVI